MRSMLTSLLVLSLLVGCSPRSSTLATQDTLPELVALSTAEVAELAKSAERPMNVEFSVLHGCVRCAEMRPEVCQLASEQAGRFPIKRADFVSNQPLLQSLGATVCPTYVLFAADAPPQIHTSPQVLLSRVNPVPLPLAP